ncbi:MAG: TIGR04283 family arsenosugar biosynthesis glycosyltransferase [Chitinophagales bacterium]
MKISVIIPTLNEVDNIRQLVPHLLQYGDKYIAEVLVVDGDSTDQTLEVARQLGAIPLKSPQRGRAKQMNFGATHATGDILYFVHADTRPPTSFAEDICKAIEENYPIGSFRFKFNFNKGLLKINAFFTRFDRLISRGGDQSLFVSKSAFENLNGFDEQYRIMEDYEFIIRARKTLPFKIIPKAVIVSARKYEQNNYFRVNIANGIVYGMFLMGASQDSMINMYNRLLNISRYGK